MVSLGTGLNLAIIGVAALSIFLLFKNAGKIGSFIGGGLNQFGSNIISGISGLGGGLLDNIVSTSPEQIVGSLDLADQTTDVPTDLFREPITGLELGRLTFAQFLKQNNFGGQVNISTGVFRNAFTTQPLDFTIDPISGVIRTGRVGLSDATLSAQQKLSARFGIPTFDIKGNLSTFGGFVTGNQTTR